MSHKKENPKPYPRLIALSAPSGAGKSTLCERLIAEFPDQITLSISTTTRGTRPYEENGVHYFFVTPEEFQKKIDAGEFAEWAEVHGNRYGTSIKTVENALAKGKHVLFDIDVQGAMSLKKLYGDRTILVFIEPPSMQILADRLRKRQGDSPQAIERRLQNAYNELAWSLRFDYQIVNDDLESAYQNLKEILRKEGL